jgi:prevent-host-death family protein
MADIPLRELRNHTSQVLRRVESGERLTILVDRRPVAELVPLPRRRRWVPAGEVMARITANRADPALRQELRELLDERLDDL